MSFIFIIENYPNKTHLNFLNNFILHERKMNISIITYGRRPNHLCLNFPVEKMNLISFDDLYPNPVNAFSMYDNLSCILNKMKTYCDVTKIKSPIVVILASHLDNCSKIISLRLLATLIALLKLENWQFLFFSENKELLEVARVLGCTPELLNPVEDLTDAFNKIAL